MALHAETGYDAWLRYAPLEGAALAQSRQAVPAAAVLLDDSDMGRSAQAELVRGVARHVGPDVRAESSLPRESAIVLGTLEEIRSARPDWHLDGSIPAEGFRLKTVAAGSARYTVIAGADARGLLYGSFALLRKIALGEPIATLDERQSPYAPIRWVNQWDNLDGSHRARLRRPLHLLGQRQSARRSHARVRLRPPAGLARHQRLLHQQRQCRSASCWRRTSCRRSPASPRPSVRGACASCSRSISAARNPSAAWIPSIPLDPRVAAWWKSTESTPSTRAIPDFGGFVLKADSEGRVGPSTYGRTHADAANVVARALAPHGGLLFYRGFVYDHHMDWRNLKNDRARAAYDNFHDLDGKFDDNVIIQIKNGPIDFQVREPASPLFGALEKTNQAIELQVTQEYFGQARHTVFLVPMWKETLDFDMHATPADVRTARESTGRRQDVFHRPTGGFVGVVNVGLDDNWLGNHLSQANLYGFGRLAWNPDLSSRRDRRRMDPPHVRHGSRRR